MSKNNEALAQEEFEELWKWYLAEINKILEYFLPKTGDGFGSNKEYFQAKKELGQAFYSKLTAIRKKYGIPEPKSK